MIVIVDYGMGNLGSVYKSLRRISRDVIISESKKDIEVAEKIVLPGVGHFKNGMSKLQEYDYLEVLNHKVIEKKVPILGICLGMQLFAKFSYEGDVNGLGWLDAEVLRFEVAKTARFKVPHMGWNSIKSQKDSKLLAGIGDKELFYFVHSYYMSCFESQDILAKTNYTLDFTSIVHKDNIYGTQFHPEKSHDIGFKLLTNFIKNS